MKTIELNGRALTLTCNMRALITYQRLTGSNPFDLEHMTDDQKVMYDITVGWCMLSAADQDAVSIDELMDSIDTFEKQAAFSKAVAEELTRFYKSEPGDSDMTDRHEVKSGEEGEDKDKYEKNA